MADFLDLFGGSTLQAAQVAYRSVSLSTSIVTQWPPYATALNYLARIMDVTPSAGSLTITLPDATFESQGQDCFFTNKGADTYTVLDAAGGTVMTVAAGQVKYIYLTSNTTAAGVWSVVVMGVGSSNLDAAALAGLGLVAITNTLNAASPVSTVSASRAIAASDRAATLIWDGGSGTLTLPLASTVTSDFFFEVRNQGTGVLTLSPTGGEVIDSSATIALQLNESAIIHAGTAAWFTVGRGRNTQFDFTQLVKAVAGGTTTLTLTEAANVVQTYTGVLLANQIVVVPGVVQVYYIRNQTTGSFNFRVQSPTPGAVVDLPSGQNSILFCDGVNVYNATTYVTTVTTFPQLTVNSRSSNTIYIAGNNGSMNQYTGTFTQTFTAAATLAAGWYVDVQNVGTGVITFDANAAETFNTQSGARQTINMYPGEGFRIVCSGTAFDLVGRSQVVALAQPQTLAAALTVDLENGFTDDELNKINIEFSELTNSGTVVAMRVKKTGVYITGATYSSGVAYSNGTAALSLTGQTFGYVTGVNRTGANQETSGVITVMRPTATAGNGMISVDSAIPEVSNPQGNRAMIGNYESTAVPVTGVRLLDGGGGALSGRVIYFGYRG